MAGLQFLNQVRAFCSPAIRSCWARSGKARRPTSRSLRRPAWALRAAFNLNLLARINRELGGDFDLAHFEHVAKINHHTRSVEMHLRSRRRQTVNIAAAELSAEFMEGETIWTKAATSILSDEVVRMACTAGFRCDIQWIDEQWPFAENLLIGNNLHQCDAFPFFPVAVAPLVWNFLSSK